MNTTTWIIVAALTFSAVAMAPAAAATSCETVTLDKDDVKATVVVCDDGTAYCHGNVSGMIFRCWVE